MKLGGRFLDKWVQFLVCILFSLFIFTACQNSVDQQEESSSNDYEDDKMVGNIWDINKKDNSVVVNISDWMKRGSKGTHTDEGYSYTAKITEETVMKYENGTKASFDEIKVGQKVQINPPMENNLEVPPEEIILLEMTYEEKYASLLSHIEGFNIVYVRTWKILFWNYGRDSLCRSIEYIGRQRTPSSS